MDTRYGIILIDPPEITIRIYETDHKEWKLLHYENFVIKTPIDKTNKARELTELLADFLVTNTAQQVSEWKAGSRGIPPKTVNYISASLAIEIENITPLREQELLCKGMFTELW